MNNISKLIGIASIIFLCSCGDENDIRNDQLNGSWNLVEVTCFCEPSNLKDGEHVWTFNLNSKEVSVYNLNNKPLQILETGTYEFDLTDSTIRINTTSYDYYFENEKLFLADRPEADGPLMEFIR